MSEIPVFGNPNEPVSLGELVELESKVVSLLKTERRFCFMCGIKLTPNFTGQQHFKGCVLSVVRRLIATYNKGK